MRTSFAFALAVTLASSPLAHAQSDPTVKVGPWTIATVYKADKFDSCTMGRAADGMEIGFARTRDGLSLMLDSAEVEARARQGLSGAPRRRRPVDRRQGPG